MKLPPKEKILEAYSAIADKRIQMHENTAECLSSDRQKTYVISFEGNTYASSDNATYWQGYPGYPILAVLLLQGRLTYRPDLVEKMKGIPWKQLNDANKRDYTAAAEKALENVPEKEEIKKLAERNNSELASLNLTIKRKRK